MKAKDRVIEKIALLNFGGIGDEILFSPVIHSVKQACPDAHLTLILEARSSRIKELMPEIDATVEIQLNKYSRGALFFKLLKTLRAKHFDAVISSGSSPFISVLLALSGIPVKVGYDSGLFSRTVLTSAAPLYKKTYAGNMYHTLAIAFLQIMERTVESSDILEPALPKLTLDASAEEKAREILQGVDPGFEGKRVMIHPGVSKISVLKNIAKVWPVENWEALLHVFAFRHPDAHLYLLGGPDDKDVIAALEVARTHLPEEIGKRIFNLYGKTTNLKELGGLMRQASALVSVDSAPMHMAVGLNVPVVAIFAATDPEKLLPKTSQFALAVRGDLACRPCLWDKRKTSCDKPVCQDVPVETVLEKLEVLVYG